MFILKFISEHYWSLFFGFTSVVELNGITKQQFQSRLRNGNKRMMLSAILSVMLSVDTVYNIVRTSSLNEHYFYYLTKVWPATAEQRNVISLGAYMSHPLFYMNLVFEKWTHLDALFYVQAHDKHSIIYHDRVLSKVLAQKVLSYHYRLKNVIKIFNVLVTLAMNLVWSAPYFVVEIFFPSKDSWSVRNTIYKVLSPIYLSYISFVVIYPNCFWLNCHFVRIVQDYYIDWLKKSTIIISKRPHKIRFVYPMFNTQFRYIFEVLKDIGSLNGFWTKYISGMLFVYCYEVCYVFFTMVTAKSLVERLQLSLLMTFGVAYFIYIYSVSVNCSKIYQNNSKLHRYIRMFLVRVNRSKVLRVKNIHQIHAQHSFEQFFRCSGFRLINGVRINNRMFEFLFTTIAIISLKLFGKKLVEYF